jgi:hypothetical protein
MPLNPLQRSSLLEAIREAVADSARLGERPPVKQLAFKLALEYPHCGMTRWDIVDEINRVSIAAGKQLANWAARLDKPEDVHPKTRQR